MPAAGRALGGLVVVGQYQRFKEMVAILACIFEYRHRNLLFGLSLANKPHFPAGVKAYHHHPQDKDPPGITPGLKAPGLPDGNVGISPR